MGGDLAPNLGDQKIFLGPISGKISIFRVNISDDLFLVIDLVLRIFPFFSHIFRMFTMLNVVYDHFLTRKPPFFTVHTFTHIRQHCFSKYWGGDQCMGRPPTSNFGGTVPPVPPPDPAPPSSQNNDLAIILPRLCMHIAGSSRATQLVPVASTSHQMATSCGPVDWTAPSGRGTCARDDNFNNTTSRLGYSASATVPPGSGWLLGELKAYNST